MKPLLTATPALLLAACASLPGSQSLNDVERSYASPTAAYASGIVIPPGYETIRLPGMVATVIDDTAEPGTIAAYGDTEAQTDTVLNRIEAALATYGLGPADVVAMTIYLAAPEPGAGMDFAGMMRAYSKHYGSEAQPNRPVRSTVEVAGIVAPGMLVEIEVTAVRAPDRYAAQPDQV